MDRSTCGAVGGRSSRSPRTSPRTPIVVIKSTVPVGTNAEVAARLRELTGRDCDVASNPEFLKEGTAIDDFMKPDRVVVGARRDEVVEVLCGPLSALPADRQAVSGHVAGERGDDQVRRQRLLATKISFINEMANLCERTGADINEVRRGIGHDSRIGFAFLFPGVGYGGSCFPKDVRALAATARQHGVEPRILDAVHEVNERQKTVLRARRSRGISAASWPARRSPFGDWRSSRAPTTSARRRRWC